jgi:hypothetical protein
MEGTPLPNSCRTKVMRFDPSRGTSRTVLVLPASEAAGGAIPNPDGLRVVYEARPCAGFADSHYVVADLRTGRSVEIGATDTPCHAAHQPSWSRIVEHVVRPGESKMIAGIVLLGDLDGCGPDLGLGRLRPAVRRHRAAAGHAAHHGFDLGGVRRRWREP